MICIPTKGEIKAKTTACLRDAERFLNSKGINTDVVFAEGTIVPVVRTKLLDEFKKYSDKFTHLLFLDSDQTFEKDYIYKLLLREKDIIVAPSKTRDNKVYNLYKYDANFNTYIAHENISGLGLIEVDAAGMGMMLIKKEVVFCINKIETGNNRSEDIYFCERVKGLGFKIYADCDLNLGHIVTIEIF